MSSPISMPPTAPEPTGTPATSWVDGAWAEIDKALHSDWLMYAVAGTLALLLLLSVLSRRKRTKAEAAGRKADLTATDRAVTRITGILATAVVATGAWKVFGIPALHLHPAIRLVLFFFAEAQVIAAWRRVRRHIHRHAELGAGTRTIYGIALGSATVAAFDASATVEILLRFFAAFVAAYMIVEELAEELDIHLTANPHLRTEERRKPKRGLFGVKWALTWERVLVWLRVAEPTERSIEEVERQRRIARFARTAYRLHLLEERKAKQWRVGFAEWRLRRQTESGNEHLNLAGDPVALGAVRAHLALLYGAKAGTSRSAVADLNPLTPAPRRALADRPYTITADPQQVSQDALTRTVLGKALSEPGASQPGSHTEPAAGNGGGNHAAISPAADAAKPGENAPANGGKPAAKPAHPLADHPNESVRRLAKAFSRKPGATNADLAKLAKVSPGTANRYMADVRAAFASQRESDSDSQERAPGALIPPTFELPAALVTKGVNGNHPTTTEETR